MKSYSNVEPLKYESAGNGGHLYRMNIKEEPVQGREEGQEPGIQYSFDEYLVFDPVTTSSLTERVLTELWPSNYEQKLINEFNAANAGLIGGGKSSSEAKAKIKKYTDFLQERITVKEQIDADCRELGIY